MPQMRAAAEVSMRLWSGGGKTALTFAFVDRPDAADIIITFGEIDGIGNTLGFAYLPLDAVERQPDLVGDIVIDIRDWPFLPEILQWLLLTHEMGHSIGLEHTDTPGMVMGPLLLETWDGQLGEGDARRRDLLYPLPDAIPPTNTPRTQPTTVPLDWILRAYDPSDLSTFQEFPISQVLDARPLKRPQMPPKPPNSAPPLPLAEIPVAKPQRYRNGLVGVKNSKCPGGPISLVEIQNIGPENGPKWQELAVEGVWPNVNDAGETVDQHVTEEGIMNVIHNYAVAGSPKLAIDLMHEAGGGQGTISGLRIGWARGKHLLEGLVDFTASGRNAIAEGHRFLSVYWDGIARGSRFYPLKIKNAGLVDQSGIGVAAVQNRKDPTMKKLHEIIMAALDAMSKVDNAPDRATIVQRIADADEGNRDPATIDKVISGIETSDAELLKAFSQVLQIPMSTLTEAVESKPVDGMAGVANSLGLPPDASDADIQAVLNNLVEAHGSIIESSLAKYAGVIAEGEMEPFKAMLAGPYREFAMELLTFRADKSTDSVPSVSPSVSNKVGTKTQYIPITNRGTRVAPQIGKPAKAIDPISLGNQAALLVRSGKFPTGAKAVESLMTEG